MTTGQLYQQIFKNIPEAKKWYKLAAAQRQKQAIELLADIGETEDLAETV